MFWKKYIRGHDMFGHKVSLNFNKDSDTYKTGCGGVFSILIKLILLFYVGLKMKALFLRENNQYGKNELPTGYEKLGEISLDQTNVVPFMQAMSTQNFQPIKFTKEIYEPYISINAMNFENSPTNPKMSNFEMKTCTIEDFKGVEDNFKRLSRNGVLESSLLCLDQTESIKFKNGMYHKEDQIKSMNLLVTKC